MSNIIKKKIDASKVFNCKNFQPFLDSVIEVLPYRGVSMSTFYLCELEGVRFLTKLTFYYKSLPEIYNAISKSNMASADAEIQILTKLKENIIDTGVSPCVLEIIYSKICTGMSSTVEKCDEPVIKDDKESKLKKLICEHKSLTDAHLAHDKCSFVVLERCDITLGEYMRKVLVTPMGFIVFKSILFQIIYTMHAIIKKYPAFRHYDLHDGNIMLKIDYKYKYDVHKPRFMKFVNGSGGVGGADGKNNTKTFFIPYFGIIAKIIDFGYSKLPEEGIISPTVDDPKVMYFRPDNDLLLLFNDIYVTVKNSPVFNEVLSLLEELDPKKMFVDYVFNNMRDYSKTTTYDEMINNKTFDEYVMLLEPQSVNIVGTYVS
jgi:serine/threonine protein kinase